MNSDQSVVRFDPVHTSPAVLCHNCGNLITAQYGITLCSDCISLTVDITKNIEKHGTLTFCKNCSRLAVPPNHWVHAPRESRELIAQCLKRLSGLNKLKLKDAKFIWTEPHSRRTKIKITCQGEAEEFNNAVIVQSFEVEFYEASAQCPDCAKSYTANTWNSCVQIRQKVPHKKTFYYIEQLILKNKAHKNTISIKENKEGLDFFYGSRNHAVKMVEFISSIAPVRVKKSEELISQDSHSGFKTFKFSFSVEIVPICKDDLLILTKPLARSLRNISQLVLCTKIGKYIQLLDPVTLDYADLSAATFWKTPFEPLLRSQGTLTEFMVLDTEPAGKANNKYLLSDVQVARTSDLGRNDNTIYVRTHLGGLLHPGDLVLGYDLTHANLNNEIWDSLKSADFPDVFLVKKSYSGKQRNRNWKLRRMAKEHNDLQERSKAGEKIDATYERSQREYEEFLEEIERDSDLRQEIDLYRDESKEKPVEEDKEDSDDEELEIDLEELKLESDTESDDSM